ncbi:hypothetical protein [Burkholderia ubonensis]|uniref:hypothetical protein n=1 Tax=Burkholderia ubonensis TaxID=101571 RepID=UPI000757B584|nr:hypothetical protein [Burkholderia ubonensis]KVO15113.1 hypothetical protein WJ74_10690 [Burkholderia ubonensis]KVT01162.1 hypothetical protein WK47_25140 [Burkholderia ubonensis]KVT07405.1 hypothetical protein WK46_10765 [Burkholderia ubonensis]KVT33817.1 hypothetical protein WK50_02515 [Burkholderia ubonensis]
MQTEVRLYPRTEADLAAESQAAERAAPKWSYNDLTAAAESAIQSYQNHPMCADAVYSFWNSLTAGKQVESDQQRLKALVTG